MLNAHLFELMGGWRNVAVTSPKTFGSEQSVNNFPRTPGISRVTVGLNHRKTNEK